MDSWITKPARTAQLSSLGIYGTMFLLLVGAAIWMGFDLVAARTRIVHEKTLLAVQQSQFLSQWFGTTIISADYVLRDILDKVSSDAAQKKVITPGEVSRLTPWLAKKMSTVPGAVGLGLFDEDCVFRLSADPTKNGIKSNMSFCADPTITPEDRAYIQYVPTDKSASRSPAILVSRPHISPDRRFLGGALAAFHLGEFQRRIMTFPIGKHDVVALMDCDRTLLAHNPPPSTDLGKQTLELEGMPHLEEQRSSSSLINVSPLDGRMRIYGLSKIENVPIVCMVGFDLEDSLSEWKRRTWQLTAGFLGMAVLYTLALRSHLVTLKQWDHMRELAVTDPLTGVANRRRVVLAGERELKRSLRYGGDVSLLMVDIDRFKTINDHWGHPTGDRVIQALADTMKTSTREQDIVGRLGGEEFLIILTETDRQGATIKAERLRESVQNTISVTSDDNQTVQFSISVGVTTVSPHDTAFADALSRADKALYAAKDGGRNQVVALWPDAS